MKHCLTGIIVGLYALNASAQSPDVLQLCGYKEIFSDDFSTLSIAPHDLGNERWTAHTPWNGDFGDAVFTDPGRNGPFSTTSEGLSITARRSPEGKWTSGLIAAADSSGKGAGLQYGYFEARMRMPPGSGTWPAFWLSALKPVSDKRPALEVDVVEYYGHDDAGYMSSLHVWYDGKDHAQSRHASHYTRVDSGLLIAGLHDYGVLVTPQDITFYLDRKAVWRRPTPAEHTLPLYPLVNLALGSGYSIKNAPNPSVLTVRYVRMYAPVQNGSASLCKDAT